jgi:hypothetical protein
MVTPPILLKYNQKTIENIPKNKLRKTRVKQHIIYSIYRADRGNKA